MSSDAYSGLDQDPLVGELAAMLREADPVPPLVVEAARSCFGWQALDAELARLSQESTPVGAGVRGEPPRLLSYQAGEWTIEVEVSDLGGRLRVLGQLVPPGPALIRADHPAGAETATADQLGRFVFHGLRPGPTRFACQPLGPDGNPSGPEIVSESLLL